ncbi:MAG: zf-HC2 domain-containing protein [Deltaproteobacteria bacterium]|nr:zf-HC2 domain-containing protein [Deltaproteobacteria bacterium]
MDHQQAKDKFSDYYEDSLDMQQRAAIEAHFGSCSECRAEYEAFKETLRGLSGLHQLAQPIELSKKVARRIHRRSAGRFFGDRAETRFSFEWLSLVVILILLVVVFVVTTSEKRVITPLLPPVSADAGVSSVDGSSTDDLLRHDDQ